MNSEIDENLRFGICDEVTIEDFSDVSLLFLAKQIRLLKINSVTKLILELMDGKTSISEIKNIITTKYYKDEGRVGSDVSQAVLNLISEGVIYPEVKIIKNGEFKMNDKTKFLANPDVSCRVEDEDGAILFNPDNDSTQIINPIGLEIWRLLDKHPKTLVDVIDSIKNVYKDAPAEEVGTDVAYFVKDLHSKGFIGEVVDE